MELKEEPQQLILQELTTYIKRTFQIKNNFILKYGDVTDPANINSLINEILPDEVYNLAAQSHVQVSFATPLYTSMTNSLGVINILESIKELRSKKLNFIKHLLLKCLVIIHKKYLTKNQTLNL